MNQYDRSVTEYRAFLDQVSRKGKGFRREPFDDYRGRVGHRLRNIPGDVLDQWIWENWSDFLRNWAWLGLDGLSFTLEEWPTAMVCDELKAWCHETFEREARAVARDPGQKLLHDPGKYIRENGTWPRPIIVLLNTLGLSEHPNGGELHEPFNLLEGHTRWEMLTAIRIGSLAPYRDTHLAWLCDVDPARVRLNFRYEPN